MKYTVEMKDKRFPDLTIAEIDSKEAWKKGKELIDSGQYTKVTIFGEYGTMVFHEDDLVEFFHNEKSLTQQTELIPKYTENIFF